MFAVVSIFLIFIIFDSDPQESSITLIEEEDQNIETIGNKNDEIKQHISIEYDKSPQKKQKNKKDKEKTTTKQKQNYDYDDYSKLADTISNEQKKYNVSTSTTKSGKFIFKVASSDKIAKANPSAFPMLPAFIKGKIDGVAYSVVIPVDLQNKDLVLKIENSDTGEIKNLPFPISELKSGSNIEVDIDYDNIDNYHIKKENSILGPPAPPIKAPLLPGQV
jgi:hypothetical protein